MSGIVKFNDKDYWNVATWAYKGIFSETLRFLPDNQKRLFEQIEHSLMEGSLPFLGFNDFSLDEKYALLQSVKDARVCAEVRGPSCLHLPQFFKTYIDAFDSLIKMMDASLSNKL
jgi:hypothetical protein